MSAAAVILRRRKRLIRRFTELGATRPERAVAFVDVGLRRSWIFDRMLAQGVFRPVGADRFYLDEAAAAKFLEAQQKRVRVMTAVMAVVFAWILVILAWSGR